MRTQSKFLYGAESFMFNFPQDIKLLLYVKVRKHLKFFIIYLILASMATPMCLFCQALIRVPNFFTVKLKHFRKDSDGENDDS
jgi:hypothetical protein